MTSLARALKFRIFSCPPRLERMWRNGSSASVGLSMRCHGAAIHWAVYSEAVGGRRFSTAFVIASKEEYGHHAAQRAVKRGGIEGSVLSVGGASLMVSRPRFAASGAATPLTMAASDHGPSAVGLSQ